MNLGRYFVSGILFLSLFYLPFWVVFFLGILAMFYFKNFYEFLMLMLFADSLFFVQNTKFQGYFLATFLFSFLVYLVIEFLKKKLVFDSFGELR
jgi:hypothetical protein